MAASDYRIVPKLTLEAIQHSLDFSGAYMRYVKEKNATLHYEADGGTLEALEHAQKLLRESEKPIDLTKI